MSFKNKRQLMDTTKIQYHELILLLVCLEGGIESASKAGSEYIDQVNDMKVLQNKIQAIVNTANKQMPQAR